MRFVAGVASCSAGMFGDDNLREPLWLGLIGFVTARAEDCRVRKLRDHRGRIFRVPSQRAVASFAGYLRVFALALNLGLIRVTGFTGIMAGEFDRARSDVVHSAGTKMAILTKFGWDNSTPY